MCHFISKRSILFVSFTESLKMNPKLKKGSTTKAKKIVQPIPLDITGRPVFPIVLGGLTVHSLGEVGQRLYLESSAIFILHNISSVNLSKSNMVRRI
jgi:hypothetical protein